MTEERAGKRERAQGGVTRRSIRPPRIHVYVDAVAQYRSIRKAAEALNIASSALNRRILDLEEELGAQLFERFPRGVRLTSAGELFVGYVRRSLADLDLACSQIELLRGLVRGVVRVAAVESVAGDLLPTSVAEFQSRHPGVRFDVKIGGPQDLLSALIADQVDLILTHERPRHRDVAVVAATSQILSVFIVSDHPLAGRPSLRLRDCLDYPLALADESLAGRALIDQALAKASFRFEPMLVSNSVEMMMAFARRNGAICFQFGSSALRQTARAGMVAVPLVDPLLADGQLLLAARRERVLPVAAAAFAEQLKASFASA